MSGDGTKLIVYERITLVMSMYEINLRANGEKYEPLGDFDVIEDFHEIEDNAGRQLAIDPDELLLDLRISPDGKDLRIYIDKKPNSSPFFIDVDIPNRFPEFDRLGFKYEDKAVFKLAA